MDQRNDYETVSFNLVYIYINIVKWNYWRARSNTCWIHHFVPTYTTCFFLYVSDTCISYIRCK